MALLWKETCNARHPMHLCQPVFITRIYADTCVAVRYSVLQCVSAYMQIRVLHCGAVWCSVVQCVAVCICIYADTYAGSIYHNMHISRSIYHNMHISRFIYHNMHMYVILRAGPPLRSWYLSGTKHFRPTILVVPKWKGQLGWVIKPVPHDLVRRIRFWRIK